MVYVFRCDPPNTILPYFSPGRKNNRPGGGEEAGAGRDLISTIRVVNGGLQKHMHITTLRVVKKWLRIYLKVVKKLSKND